MKNPIANLHMESKRALAIMLSFAMAFSVLYVFVMASVSTRCACINSLWKSDYLYSATTIEPLGQDEYFQFDAGISFAVQQDARSSFNAEILMQESESEYTSMVYWNADQLSTYGVAITQGLARKYGLSTGDKIYSKHVVDGTTHEYEIEQIIPEITSPGTGKNNYSDGVIVIGYDDLYDQNLTHTNLVFTKEKVESLSEEFNAAPTDISYRSDELAEEVWRVLPYLLIFIVLAILLMAVLSHLITKSINANFRRLAALGYDRKELDSSYNKLLYSTAIGSIVISAIVGVIISQAFVLNFVEIMVLLIIILAEIITLFLSAGLSRKQLWR